MTDITVVGSKSVRDKDESHTDNISFNKSILCDEVRSIKLETNKDEHGYLDNNDNIINHQDDGKDTIDISNNKGHNENNNKTTNLEKLLEKSLMKAYLYTSLPPFLSQLAASLLLFVDGIVISSLLNNEGLSGLTYASSVQFILQGFAQIISTGSISILSTLIGSNESLEYRDLIPSIIFWLNIIFSSISYLLLLFVKEYFILIGAENTVLTNAYDYAKIIIYTCPVFYFYWTYSMAILGEGLSRWNMLSNILSAVFNAPLSYILIKYAKIGVKGAALGSTLSCFIAGLLCISLFFTNKTVTKIRPLLVFKRFKESWNLTKRILLIGLGDGLSYVAMTVTSSLFQYFFTESFSPEERVDGFASIGAFSRTYALFMAFFLGLGSLGYLPIAGYYIGQKNKKKLIQITKYASYTVSSSLLIITVLCLSLHKYIGSLFSTNDIFLYYYKLSSFLGIPTIFMNGVKYVIISYGQALGLNIRLVIVSILCLVFYQPILLVIFYYAFHSTFFLLFSYPGNDILSMITLIIIFFKPLKKPDNYIINQVKSIQEKDNPHINEKKGEMGESSGILEIGQVELENDDDMEKGCLIENINRGDQEMENKIEILHIDINHMESKSDDISNCTEEKLIIGEKKNIESDRLDETELDVSPCRTENKNDNSQKNMENGNNNSNNNNKVNMKNNIKQKSKKNKNNNKGSYTHNIGNNLKYS